MSTIGKSIIIGIGAAILAFVAFAVWSLYQGIAMTGSGGIGAVSVGVSELWIQSFLAGLLVGFLYWRIRRRARR